MSAIFGVVHLRGQPVCQTDLDLMAAASRSGGPDGGGCWKSGNIGLGMQLMRITAEDFLEKQPLSIYCRVLLNSNEFVYVP